MKRTTVIISIVVVIVTAGVMITQAQVTENSSVVINEFMASNTMSLSDPQGDYDDWIELHNLSDQEIELSGMYLSDEKNNPRKWAFPENSVISPGGYLIVWADGDANARPGLHTNFKLSRNGEMVMLVDKDERGNKVLDSIEFGRQESDVAYGRFPDGTGGFRKLTMTPGERNAKRPHVKSKVANRTTLGGYVQVQFRTTNEDDAVPNNTFTVRRGHFQIESELTDSLSTMLEVDATTDCVDTKDLYLKYKISPKFSLEVGQTQKPFSFVKLQSSRELFMIERPLHVREYFDVYLGRDVGLIAEYEPHERISIAMSVFNGSGSGPDAVTDDNNAKDFVGRVELIPAKRLTMGFNVSSHGLTEDSDGTPIADKRVTAYGADLSFRYGGFQAAAEGLFGDKPSGEVDAQMIGLYITLVHKRELEDFVIAAIENGGRIEFADGDSTIDNDAVISVTPYVGLYFHPNARLQICPVLRFPQQGDMVGELITQVQIEF